MPRTDKQTERMIFDVKHLCIELAAEKLGTSVSKLRKTIEDERKKRETAERNHKKIPSGGIPYYQATKGDTLWFPEPGLREYVRQHTYGVVFDT